MDFLRRHSIMNAPLSVDHFQSSLFGGFAAASDDWTWSTDKGKFIIKWLLNPKEPVLFGRGRNLLILGNVV